MSIVARLRKQIKTCGDQIKAIQAQCPHPESAGNKTPTKLEVTIHYEDEIGGQAGIEWRDGYTCVCGLCEAIWYESADGRQWSYTTKKLPDEFSWTKYRQGTSAKTYT